MDSTVPHLPGEPALVSKASPRHRRALRDSTAPQRTRHACPPRRPPQPTHAPPAPACRLAQRMIRPFPPAANGSRPLYGPRGTRKAEIFAHDPHWKDLILFYEYFNGDTGEGLGASHQTGWTALVASLIDEWRN